MCRQTVMRVFGFADDPQLHGALGTYQIPAANGGDDRHWQSEQNQVRMSVSSTYTVKNSFHYQLQALTPPCIILAE